MSVTHNWFGPVPAKSRSTRSAAIWSGLAWRHVGRPVAPARPTRRISRATVRSVSQAWRIARADGGRERQA